MKKDWLGEFVGTFILVFIGCSTVAIAVLFNAFSALWQVATVWGIGVALAIYASRTYSHAHLNPAVSAGFWLDGKINGAQFFAHSLFQFLGAFVAGWLVYLCFNTHIEQYETMHQISRLNSDSNRTAMIFGEFFPNPGYSELKFISVWLAASLEGIATFVLMFVILLMSKLHRFSKIIPIIIGAMVALLICLIAPYTQAGLNPARDFAPRLVAYFAGWGTNAFPNAPMSFFTVYILGPILGALLAVKIHQLLKLNDTKCD